MNKEYDIRNTDEIEGLDLRINKLREMGYGELADQQLSFLFNDTVEAFHRLKRDSEPARRKRKEVKLFFNRHFSEMMLFRGFTTPQKMKIAMFRYFPEIYTLAFGTGL